MAGSVSAEFIVIALLGVALGVAFGLLWARRSAAPLASPPEAALTQTLQKLQQDVGGLRENVARLPSADAVGAVQRELAELKGGYRDGNKKGREAFAADMQNLRAGLVKVTAELEETRSRDQEAQRRMQKIEAVLGGAQSRGAAGEVVLAEAFSQFPPEMADTQFKVNGKPVEFALILPNQKRLPIDSKWPAAKELLQYAETSDEAARKELLEKIEKAVTKKVEEVTKYIDAATTTSLAVAAVPDAAYFACRTAHIEAFKQRVLLMPYSMTIPFLLALYNLHLQFARSVDQENLDAYLSQIEALLTQVEDKLENSVQRGATMVTNAYLELREWISQMRGTISTLRGLPGASLAEKQQSLLKD